MSRTSGDQTEPSSGRSPQTTRPSLGAPPWSPSCPGGGAGSRGLALGAGTGAGGWPWYLYWVVGDLAASNIFLRPSMPDMASTFFLQSPTSTGRSCEGHTRRLSAGPPGAIETGRWAVSLS